MSKRIRSKYRLYRPKGGAFYIQPAGIVNDTVRRVRRRKAAIAKSLANVANTTKKIYNKGFTVRSPLTLGQGKRKAGRRRAVIIL